MSLRGKRSNLSSYHEICHARHRHEMQILSAVKKYCSCRCQARNDRLIKQLQEKSLNQDTEYIVYFFVLFIIIMCFIGKRVKQIDHEEHEVKNIIFKATHGFSA